VTSSTPSRCAARSWTDQPGQAVGRAQSPVGRLASSATGSARNRGTSGLVSTGSSWDGERILVIGHVATRWGLDHYIRGSSLEDLIEQDFAWREGWEYQPG